MACALDERWLTVDRTAKPLGSGCDGIVFPGKMWRHVDVAVKEFYMVSVPTTYGIESGSLEQRVVCQKIQQEAG